MNKVKNTRKKKDEEWSNLTCWLCAYASLSGDY